MMHTCLNTSEEGIAGIRQRGLRTIAAFGIIAMIAGCATTAPTYRIADVEPIRVRFGSVRTVFVHPDAPPTTVEFIKHEFMTDEYEYVINAVMSEKDEETWCNREKDKKTHSQPFRVRHGSVEKLQDLKRASIAQLTDLLEKPVSMMAAYDGEGTVVWFWLTCNGELGDRFQAMEVAAGFQSDAKREVQFLLIRVAQGE